MDMAFNAKIDANIALGMHKEKVNRHKEELY